MLFNSIRYLIFLPLTVVMYYAFPGKWRWILLLAASYLFYAMWKVEYVLLLMAATAVSYFAALGMEAHTGKKRKKLWLWAALTVNLGMLFVFKYLGFFTGLISGISDLTGLPGQIPFYTILLPVGISFYTFQTLGYVIDVYRGVAKPEKHAGIYALYVTFFPQLVAGPIERARNLLPQFRQQHTFDPDAFASGLRLILWGMFKKIVIADRIAVLVQPVYGQPEYFYGIQIAIALPLLIIQVYADFSGYTDIAIGSARLMGFRLSRNFNRPFSARSVADFWNRWHITLTTWLRDYVYFSLPSRFRGKAVAWRLNLNLIITFTLVGFWHGAHWNFLIFGLLHGLFMTLANISRHMMEKFNRFSGLAAAPALLKALNQASTFMLVSITGLFFGQHSFSSTLTLIGNITDFSNTGSAVRQILQNNDFVLSLILIVFMLRFEALANRPGFKEKFMRRPLAVRAAAYLAMFFFLLIFGIFARQEFFYFQF
jgi:D-alanyl-lipoteichoic acid acyltransferase DltB (MBOAT superfamily)